MCPLPNDMDLVNGWSILRDQFQACEHEFVGMDLCGSRNEFHWSVICAREKSIGALSHTCDLKLNVEFHCRLPNL